MVRAVSDGHDAAAKDQRIDVVIVTHNSAEHLPQALGGLPDGVSVVVIDNASSDRSAAVADDLGLRVVANSVNAGFAAAANQGSALGDRPVVVFLNPDATIGADDLRHLVEALDRAPELAVVSPRLVGPDGDQRVDWPYPSAARAWRDALLPSFSSGTGLRRTRKPSTQRPRTRRVRRGFVIGACFAVRREAFEAVGGFDARFWLYGEEADLCARLEQAGWGIGVVEVAVAHHEGGASATGIEDVVFEHFQRGAEHFVAKRGGACSVASLRLAELIGSAMRVVLPGTTTRRDYHRRRVDRLLRVLRRRPGTVPLDSPATRAAGVGLVVCSLEAWDEVWRRNQFLVRELLRADAHRRVLFVEPPFDVAHELRRRGSRRPAPGLRPLEDDGRIVRVEPRKVWPRLLGPFADRSLRRQITSAAAELGFDRPDLWVNDPSFAPLVDGTSWPATYDITDDWTKAGGPTRVRQRVERREARLLDACGAVVVCSSDLAGARRAARPDLEVIPNAVDVEHFTRPRPRPADLPRAPVAVYVGTLHDDRLDVDLVVELASALPEVGIALVGPDSLSPSAQAELGLCSNVHLLGPRAYDDVPGYLQHADVVIVPHLRTPFTESLDPIKAYECVAVGRPTVATPVAGFRGLGPPVVCAEPPAFVAAVRAALASPVEATELTMRGGGAVLPSWAARGQAFRDALVRARLDADTRPLRVVYLDHCARLSGGELALVRLVQAVRIQRGVEAHVVLGESGPLVGRLEAAGAEVEVQALDARVASVPRDRVTARGLGADRAVAAGRDALALTRRLRELHPDLVHTNSLKSALYGGIAARAAGVPVVWHLRDRIATDYLPAPAVRLVHNLARWIPAAVIVPSLSTSLTIVRALGPDQPCHIIHDMVDLPDADLDEHDADHPTSPGPFRAVMVGRLAPWKGQHVFLDAFAAAFADGAEEAVVVGSAMFGEDDYEASLHAQVERLGLDGRVRFAGFIDDVGPELARADCVVHASVIAEPFGQVVVEAMAAGRALIASDLGGPSEVVTDGVDGLLCPPDDPAALADRLRRLDADPELRMALGEAAAQRARDFSAEALGPLVAACYDGVRSRHRGAARSRFGPDGGRR
jgi:glycosyltransferase involved in cell wall biosynthesis/GT2 family glycosyltransferase